MKKQRRNLIIEILEAEMEAVRENKWLSENEKRLKLEQLKIQKDEQHQ